MTLDERLDPRMESALRALHAAPETAAYWDSLHHRIASALDAESRQAWWQIVAGWGRMELLAAAALLLAAAAALTSAQRSDAADTFATVSRPAVESVEFAYTEGDAGAQDEAIIREVVLR